MKETDTQLFNLVEDREDSQFGTLYPRKILLQMQISIDGFVSDKNGDMDWMVWDWDKKIMEYVSQITYSVDCIVLGRGLAQGFIKHWKSNAENKENSDDFAKKINNTAKIVFSKSMKKNKWENTKILKGKLKEEIKNLKFQNGGDIIVYGGARLATSLVKANLIDEYYLFINPVVLGKGISIFKKIEDSFKLKLVDSNAFKCGIVINHYKK